MSFQTELGAFRVEKAPEGHLDIGSLRGSYVAGVAFGWSKNFSVTAVTFKAKHWHSVLATAERVGDYVQQDHGVIDHDVDFTEAAALSHLNGWFRQQVADGVIQDFWLIETKTSDIEDVVTKLKAKHGAIFNVVVKRDGRGA